MASLSSGDPCQRFWEGDGEEPGTGHSSRWQRAGDQHQEHPHCHRLRGHALPRDPGTAVFGSYGYFWEIFGCVSKNINILTHIGINVFCGIVALRLLTVLPTFPN